MDSRLAIGTGKVNETKLEARHTADEIPVTLQLEEPGGRLIVGRAGPSKGSRLGDRRMGWIGGKV
jgi:hypothetical protein